MPQAAVHDVALSAVRRATAGASRAVLATDPGLAARLAAEGRQVAEGPLERVPDGHLAAVLLVNDEISHAGEGAEALAHEAARALAPEGLLAVTARNRVYAEASGTPLATRAYSAEGLERLLGHYGFRLSLLCAPGAAGRLRASVDASTSVSVEDATLDIDADRDPGLLGAAPTLLALATRARDPADRSERFFETLPRKVVAASVLCRADDGRILVVHDSFKEHWTIPGGVVDAGESPRAGAEREAWEESGLRIAAGALLGVFAGTWPDRVVLVYDGVPVGGSTPVPQPVHAHEIDAAEWAEPEEALARLDPSVAFQVRRCLAEPGGTWWLPG